MKRSAFFVFILGALFVVSACKKEPVVGPQGPQGPKGDKGEQGPAGPPGPQGNANVKALYGQVSVWNLSSGLYVADVSAPDITQDIIDNGTVQLFMESSSSAGVWLNMPFIEPVSSNVQAIYNFNYALGTVRIYKYNTNGTNPTHPGNRRIKLVVISGDFIKTHPEVDIKDYTQLERYIE